MRLRFRSIAAPLATLAFLGLGLIARFAIEPMAGTIVWIVGLLIVGAPVVWRTLRDAARGKFASDVVASLAILTAVALGQPFVGLVIVLMQTGGEALETYAEGRASRAVQALEAEAPRIAHRMQDRRLADVPVDDIAIGDELLIRPGELVPCDSVVIGGVSSVDTSRLTGEAMPQAAVAGTALMSGSANGHAPLTVRAVARASESQYARIVELVRSAQASKAPLQRLADRYAVWFTPLTIAVCVVAYAITGDAMRVLAVLAVATPCPLILATPVAIVGGINSAARRQIIVRHGTALEQLGAVTVGVFDKTGTLTIGRPVVRTVHAAPEWEQATVLRLAASVEQHSSHLLARTVVDAAEEAGISVTGAAGVVESAGQGVTGWLDEREIMVGGRAYVLGRFPQLTGEFDELERTSVAAGLRAYVAIDGHAAGIIEYADALRPGIDHFFRELSALGVHRTMLLSGDRGENARAVAADVGISEVLGDLLPDDKVQVVRRLVKSGDSVMMVGDGTNDAPALSAATVGIALAEHGGGISAEAADVVILANDLGRVVEAIRISRRTLRIARQSIGVGLGLSGAAMIFAAFGTISPTAGALLQEAIDLAVIMNALRASVGIGSETSIAGAPVTAPDSMRENPTPVPALR